MMDNTSLHQSTHTEQTSETESFASPHHDLDSSSTPQNDAPVPIDYHEHDDAPAMNIRSALKELLETAIYILLVFIIVRSMVQNFKIEGSSMEPSLHDKQYILVNKLVYFNFDLNAPFRLLPGNDDLPPRIVYPLSTPERGDIVVFIYPENEARRAYCKENRYRDPTCKEKDYIKRVIGLPGEMVAIHDGGAYINNERLEEDYLIGENMPTNTTRCNPGTACQKGPVEVPEGHVFVIGDNRGNSSDSREWGTLPLEYVIGQAWLLYYPITDMGIIEHPSYASD